MVLNYIKQRISKNHGITNTNKGKRMLSWKFGVCDSKKLSFVKEQEAKHL